MAIRSQWFTIELTRCNHHFYIVSFLALLECSTIFYFLLIWQWGGWLFLLLIDHFREWSTNFYSILIWKRSYYFLHYPYLSGGCHRLINPSLAGGGGYHLLFYPYLREELSFILLWEGLTIFYYILIWRELLSLTLLILEGTAIFYSVFLCELRATIFYFIRFGGGVKPSFNLSFFAVGVTIFLLHRFFLRRATIFRLSSFGSGLPSFSLSFLWGG